MKFKHFIPSLFLLFSILFIVSCHHEESPSIEAKLQNAVDQYVKKYNYEPALNVSVYSASKNIAFNTASGKPSTSKSTLATMDTRHIYYSITKSFVAVSILKLEKEGKLALSDKLEKYVTPSDIDSYFSHGNSSLYINYDATIEELLTHRSGIKDYDDNFTEILATHIFDDGWKAEKILSFISQTAEKRDETTLKYSFNYSSANYVLLGLIVEKVSANDLSEYLKATIFTPYDLDVSVLPLDKINYNIIAHPHVYPNTTFNLEGDGKTPIDVTTAMPNVLDLIGNCSYGAGGAVGNSADVAIWGYTMLSQNSGFEKTIAKKITDSVSTFTVGEEAFAYGYGIRKLFHGDYEFIGSYGRGIGDENLMFYNKDKDVCISILSSSNTKKDGTPNIDELMYEIFEVL